MSYSTRLTVAALLSAIVHLLFLAYAGVGASKRTLDRFDTAEPIVLNLTPPEEKERMRRLVETTTPAEDRERDTDLISNASSDARDDSPDSGEDSQPTAERVSDFDELAGQDAPPSPSVAAIPPAAATDAPEPRPERESAEPEHRDERTAEPLPADTVAAADLSSTSFEEAEKASEARPQESAAEAPLPERFQVAQNASPPQSPELGTERARESAGAEAVGPLSFEANKHALGDYMLNVRRAVERTWRTTLQFKYTGTTQASTLIECAIQPDGHLAHVKILDRGESMVYAALCKQAIERAAPFPPFPFHVPEAYRSENLVIRWKFSFL